MHVEAVVDASQSTKRCERGRVSQEASGQEIVGLEVMLHRSMPSGGSGIGLSRTGIVIGDVSVKNEEKSRLNLGIGSPPMTFVYTFSPS